ncbi:Transcription factor bHLH91 [Camellia lanceoleosa]|nr:Transcription factor bHLH91 [Camellia lanceoleosa]
MGNGGILIVEFGVHWGHRVGIWLPRGSNRRGLLNIVLLIGKGEYMNDKYKAFEQFGSESFQDTEVDIRIIGDEVTIKLGQRKKINCLLIVSKVLDELQRYQHVSGGAFADNYSYLFNSKICEGSSVYASAIANKLIEVMNRQDTAIPPTSSYYG